MGVTAASCNMCRDGKTARGNPCPNGCEPQMTDEERARDIGTGIYGDGERGTRLASVILSVLVSVRREEREACAQVADRHVWSSGGTANGKIIRAQCASDIAYAIRTRTDDAKVTDAA